MTPDEMRVALSKWQGWTCVSRAYKTGLPPHRAICDFSTQQVLDGAVPVEPIPDFLNDLNAVARLEARLSTDEYLKFTNELQAIVWTTVMDADGMPPMHQRSSVSATAAQRCEALCRVLEL